MGRISDAPSPFPSTAAAPALSPTLAGSAPLSSPVSSASSSYERELFPEMDFELPPSYEEVVLRRPSLPPKPSSFSGKVKWWSARAIERITDQDKDR
ncbi:hypothetical protein JCM6882_007549 [Rhodosporidiobolus microsporus]